MTLGTTLVEDVYAAIKPSESATDFPIGIQAAVDNYLSAAEYGEGALTYASAGTPTFTLPPIGTPVGAATIIATAVMNYWLPAGVAVGVIGVATVEASVVAGTITATTILPTLTASLTAIFADLNGGQYWTNAELADHTTITGEDLEPYDAEPSLVVYNTTSKQWFQRIASAWSEVTDTKAHSIAEAIEDAVSGIVVAWTEVTPPASPVPYTGEIA